MISPSRISNLILLLVLSVATPGCIGMDYREEKDHSIAEVERVPVGDINISYKVLGQGTDSADHGLRLNDGYVGPSFPR